MTIVWHCPECRLPVRLTLATRTEPLSPGTVAVTVDADLAMRAHASQHNRDAR